MQAPARGKACGPPFGTRICVGRGHGAFPSTLPPSLPPPSLISNLETLPSLAHVDHTDAYTALPPVLFRTQYHSTHRRRRRRNRQRKTPPKQTHAYEQPVVSTLETHRQGRKMHPVETGVCCDHTSPTRECEGCVCRSTNLGLRSNKGTPGGKEDAAETKHDAIRGGKNEKAPKKGVKGEGMTDGKAGEKAVAHPSSPTTTFPSSSLSSFSSSYLSSLPSSLSQSSPRFRHYQSYSPSDRHTGGADGPILQVPYAFPSCKSRSLPAYLILSFAFLPFLDPPSFPAPFSAHRLPAHALRSGHWPPRLLLLSPRHLQSRCPV